jgi:hypothetical protein
MSAPDGGVGGNVTQETVQRRARSILAARRELDEAKAVQKQKASAVQKEWKAAKGEGINNDALKRTMVLMELTDDEIALHVHTERRYLAWLGRPVGEQAELFSGAEDEDVTDPALINDFARAVAEQAGYNAACNDEPVTNCEHPQGSELAAEWIKGHGKGVEFMTRTAPVDEGVTKASPRKPKATRAGVH